MSVSYESNSQSWCRFCGNPIELIKPKGRKVLLIHTECYEAEKAGNGVKP